MSERPERHYLIWAGGGFYAGDRNGEEHEKQEISIVIVITMMVDADIRNEVTDKVLFWILSLNFSHSLNF
jgi:hypothetical protein